MWPNLHCYNSSNLSFLICMNYFREPIRIIDFAWFEYYFKWAVLKPAVMHIIKAINVDSMAAVAYTIHS